MNTPEYIMKQGSTIVSKRTDHLYGDTTLHHVIVYSVVPHTTDDFVNMISNLSSLAVLAVRIYHSSLESYTLDMTSIIAYNETKDDNVHYLKQNTCKEFNSKQLLENIPEFEATLIKGDPVVTFVGSDQNHYIVHYTTSQPNTILIKDDQHIIVNNDWSGVFPMFNKIITSSNQESFSKIASDIQMYQILLSSVQLVLDKILSGWKWERMGKWLRNIHSEVHKLLRSEDRPIPDQIPKTASYYYALKDLLLKTIHSTSISAVTSLDHIVHPKYKLIYVLILNSLIHSRQIDTNRFAFRLFQYDSLKPLFEKDDLQLFISLFSAMNAISEQDTYDIITQVSDIEDDSTDLNTYVSSIKLNDHPISRLFLIPVRNMFSLSGVFTDMDLVNLRTVMSNFAPGQVWDSQYETIIRNYMISGKTDLESQ